MHSQQFTLNLSEDGTTIESVTITLPNGEEHCTADFRDHYKGTSSLVICTSKKTLISDKCNLQEAVDKLGFPQLKLCTEPVEMEEDNDSYSPISYTVVRHPMLAQFK